MLGRLRMSVRDCIDTYKLFGGRVFGKPHLLNARNTLGIVKRPKYDASKLENVCREISNRRDEINERRQNGLAPDLRLRKGMCKTYVSHAAFAY